MTPDNRPLRRFVRGNPPLAELSAENLNHPIEVLDQLRADFMNNRRPTHIPGVRVDEGVLGLVVATGPGGQADDTTKNRYWVIPQRPKATLAAGDALELEDETQPGLGEIVTATNLAEGLTSHRLAIESQQVLLFSVVYSGFPTLVHWFFFCEASKGKYQYQTFQMVSQNETGWDFDSLHVPVV
jgi:hypothetical protein